MEQLGSWYHKFILNGIPTAKVGYMNDSYFDTIRPLFPEDLKDKTILDLCCNAGLVSFKLAELGAYVIGLENDLNYLNQAEYASTYYDTSRVQFRLQDVDYIDFGEFNPDIIVALSCLYHLKDPLRAIRKMCDQDVLLIVSFRENLYEQYINYFKLMGKTVTNTVTYGKKIAARLE